MVNQEMPLQRHILDVFEEQEDSFYFPLRSQKDARAFVKAIHMKGVPYEHIYQSIGEFEHNFSCWRNGLGRPGIGNRIMDLINQPLVALLEEEDMFPVNGSNGHQANRREQRSWEDNNRVPPTPHSNVQKKPTATTLLAKKGSDETDSGPKITSTTNSNYRNNPPSKPAAAPEPAKQTSPLPSRSELRKVGKDEKTAQQKEEAPKRMVELRRTPPRQESKERPLSEIEKMKKQILHKKQEESEKAHSSSSGSSDSESGSSDSSSSSDSETKVEAVLEKFDAIKITDSPVEEQAPKKPVRLYLDEKKVEPKVVPKVETKVEVKVEKKEEVAKRLSAHEERREELRKEDQRLEEQKREERKEQLKKIKERYQQAPPSGVTQVEVDENYNSDLDPENANQSPVMATLVKKISAMRAAGKDSNGFIYVFSDSPQGSPKVRVKVGSSRCPNKRLQQAKYFNPNISLIASYPVAQRVSALKDTRAALSAVKLEGSPDWFTGVLADLLKQVQHSADKYPSKALDDATTGQSES